jgi:hypothetical protein
VCSRATHSIICLLTVFLCCNTVCQHGPHSKGAALAHPLSRTPSLTGSVSLYLSLCVVLLASLPHLPSRHSRVSSLPICNEWSSPSQAHQHSTATLSTTSCSLATSIPCNQRTFLTAHHHHHHAANSITPHDVTPSPLAKRLEYARRCQFASH